MLLGTVGPQRIAREFVPAAREHVQEIVEGPAGRRIQKHCDRPTHDASPRKAKGLAPGRSGPSARVMHDRVRALTRGSLGRRRTRKFHASLSEALRVEPRRPARLPFARPLATSSAHFPNTADETLIARGARARLRRTQWTT
jgi:hypothetical protein